MNDTAKLSVRLEYENRPLGKWIEWTRPVGFAPIRTRATVTVDDENHGPYTLAAAREIQDGAFHGVVSRGDPKVAASFAYRIASAAVDALTGLA